MTRVWIPHSYTLLVEHRHCRVCGATHHAPGQVRVEIHSHYGRTERFTMSLERFKQQCAVLPTLPRHTEHLHTNCSHCHVCWHNTPVEQGELWPRVAPVYATAEEIDRTKRSPLPNFADFETEDTT